MRYGVISDTHCHNWSMFGQVGVNGTNTRLQIILDEIKRAAEEVKEMGGSTLFHAGDIFHVRGTIAPSVMNPVAETFHEISEMGITPVLVCGNHDAEFRDSEELGSAISVLRGVGCLVANVPMIYGNTMLIPWQPNKEKFLEAIKELAPRMDDCYSIVCHAPLDGVLDQFASSACIHPDEIKKVAGRRLGRVFAGHIHNHKCICVNDAFVWSVGAIAHHNWGDIGTKAGFMLVDGEGVVKFRASHAPQFVEIEKDTTVENALLMADGNYVRATVEDMTEVEIKDFRTQLENAGAKGVTIICHAKPQDTAQRMEIKSSESLESIVSKYSQTKVKEMSEELGRAVLSKVDELMVGAGNEIQVH